MAPRSRMPRFEPCFDRNKLTELIVLLPLTYAALDTYAPWRRGEWPTKVRCMKDSRIVEGRKRGAGHGYTYTSGREADTIWMNPHMSSEGYWLVFVHENLHHAFPDATEHEINNVHVQHVYKTVFKRRMDPSWACKHGLGPPEPHIGDRGYVIGCDFSED